MNQHISTKSQVLIPEHIVGTPLQHGTLQTANGLTMGTTWSASWIEEKISSTEQLKPEALSLSEALGHILQTLTDQLSHWQADSALSRFNRAADNTWHVLPPAFKEVLCKGLEIAHQTHGAFDPTIGALVNAWGFGATQRYDQPGFQPPTNDQLALLQKTCGWQRLTVDVTHCRALQPGGVQLDFSGIAKGYAVDCLSQYLTQSGRVHHLVEVGGELRGRGMKPSGQPWWVSLELPTPFAIGADQAAFTATDNLKISPAPTYHLALHELAVATSGDYRRYFWQGEHYRAHTINPLTAQPLTPDLASVTVIHPQCLQADAYATALMVLGAEAGLALANDLGLCARFLMRRGQAWAENHSQAFAAMLT